MTHTIKKRTDRLGRPQVELTSDKRPSDLLFIGSCIVQVAVVKTFSSLTILLPPGCGTLCAYVLTVEYVGKRHRHVAGTALWFFWPTSLMMMALMAYLIRDWRTLNIVGAAPGLVQIFLWW